MILKKNTTFVALLWKDLAACDHRKKS